MDDPTGERHRLAGVYEGYERDRRYRTRWDPTNAGNASIERERSSVLRSQLMARWGALPTPCRVVDVGCGGGRFLAELGRWGVASGDMIGIDVLFDRLRAGRRHSQCLLIQADARQLPLSTGNVNLAVAFTVFSSVLIDEYAVQIAREIDRILAPGGVIMWYDYRVSDPLNRNTRGVGRRDIRRLFPNYDSSLRPVTVVPQVARRLGRATDVAYPALARMPWLRTHYAGLLAKAR